MTHMNYKAIGIFGFGRIGQLVAERLSPFNVTIQQYDSINQKDNENSKFVDFETFVSTKLCNYYSCSAYIRYRYVI